MGKVIKSFYEGLPEKLKVYGVDNKTYSLKNMGDGFMMFFKMKKTKTKHFPSENHSNISLTLLKEVDNLLSAVEEREDILKELQLKTVITFLTDVYFYNVESDNGYLDSNSSKGNTGPIIRHDILGRGVDFSFRLEKFGGASHYCINKMFYHCIEKHISKSNYEAIKTSKMVKGWTEPQEFYVLTNPKKIESNKSTLTESSVNDESIRVELLKYYLDKLSDNTDTVDIEGVRSIILM